MKMRLHALVRSALLAALLCAPAAQADSVAEAKALGAAAATTMRSTLSTTPAEEVTPGYTTSFGESTLSADELGSTASARIVACQTLPELASDPACEAILGARADAGVRATEPSMASDPAVQAALTGTEHVTLDGLTGTYTACAVDTVERGIVTTDHQYCHNYYKRVADEACVKTLIVDVVWLCPAGTTGPTLNAEGVQVCQRARTPACTPAEQILATDCFSFENAAPLVLEAWHNSCALYEARVPFELQWPDGVNPPEVEFLDHSPTGQVDKCARTHSACSDPHPETRFFDGIPVTRACWAYTNTFDCVTRDDVSDCGQPRFGACIPQGKPECIDMDVDGFCTAERQDFNCTHRDTRRTESEINCGERVFIDREGTVWDASYPKDDDFLTVITYMEAGRQAGRYLDPNTLTVFNGFDNRCVKKLFGLVNCCNRAGVDPQMFNNLSLAMGVAGTVGKALVSTYMFDALLAVEAPMYVINGFGSLFGMGVHSPLAGFLLGQVSVAEFVTSLIPGPWTIAMMAIQYSGILSCKEKEQILALKRDADLCVSKGNYCSKRIRFIGTCLQRTYTYCCFNSRLAKIIHTQGQAQLGISGGTTRRPNCKGFTPTQLQSLDLSRMDLSEFMDEIRAAAVEMPIDIGATISSCILGEGAC